MKFSALFILSTLFMGIVDARVGTNKSERRLELEEMVRNDPRELLQQPECDGVLDLQAEAMVKVVANGRKSAKSYFCNPITRFEDKVELQQDKEYRAKKMEDFDRFLEEASTEDLCEHAMDGEVIDGQEGVKKGTKNYKSCSEEMDKELDKMEEILKDDMDELRRLMEVEGDEHLELLLEDEEHRELWGVKRFFRRAARTIKRKVIKPAFKGVKNVAKKAAGVTKKIVRPVGNIMAGAWRICKKTGKKLVYYCKKGVCEWVWRFALTLVTGRDPGKFPTPGQISLSPMYSPRPSDIVSLSPIYTLPAPVMAPSSAPVASIAPSGPAAPPTTPSATKYQVRSTNGLTMARCPQPWEVESEDECKKAGVQLGLATGSLSRFPASRAPCGCFLDPKKNVKWNPATNGCGKPNPRILLICRDSADA